MAEKDEDVALDFLSPQFDPARALHADPSAVRLPCPDIQPCDNLDAYDSVMRGVRRQAPSGAAHEPATKKVEPEGGVAAVRAQRRFKSVLHFMESPQGPITLLQSCRSEGVRVRVWIRHCAGVRGVCEGVVTAFDKHFNLVLRDVYEEYVPFKSAANGGTDGKRRKKKRKKKDISDSQPSDQGATLDTSTTVQPSDQGATLDTSTTVQPSDQGATLDTSTTVQPSDQDKDVGRDAEAGTLSTKSPEKLTRCVRQLFVRGDNIVLVAPVHRTQPLAEDK